MDNPLPDQIESVQVIQVPPYVVALHRLIRLGKATKYLGSRSKFVLFDLNTPEGEILREKWIPLKDASSVSFIYSDPIGGNKCL